MSFNLIRNARVFFTTNVDANTGVVGSSNFSDTNTREIQVLDGMSFSQNTTTETVTISEAGATPVRGQRQFNTALDPVDFSFTTYMRPADVGNVVSAEESVLWNAMFAADPIGGTAPAWSEAASSATAVLTNSNKHQLQKFGLIFVLDGTSYIVDNCVLTQCVIDFGLDAIASAQWSGQGSTLRQIASPTIGAPSNGTVSLSAPVAGTAKAKNTTAAFIANKLSTVDLDAGIGTGSGSPSYTIALTGGSLTISNNITYLTPANLGMVNKPATYFTGTRSITGTLNCYLKSGENNSAALISQLLTDSATDVDPAYYIKISVGGSHTAPTRVDFIMPSVVLAIPAVNTEQVVSTTINFTAQGAANNAFDIGAANELSVVYVAVNDNA